MADEADRSDERIQMVVDSGVNAASKAPPEAGYLGYCLNCGPQVELPSPKRWCDQGCRDDWQKERDMAKRLSSIGS